jgi:hypothetical protein
MRYLCMLASRASITGYTCQEKLAAKWCPRCSQTLARFETDSPCEEAFCKLTAHLKPYRSPEEEYQNKFNDSKE